MNKKFLLSNDLEVKKGKFMTVFIPFKFIDIMHTLHQNLEHSKDEYCILFKVDANEDKTEYYIDDSDFYIPSQEVSSTSFTLKENIDFNRYNGAIHRHPKGVNDFSITDEKYLNDSLLVSLLYIPPFNFPKAIVNRGLDNGNLIKLEANVNFLSSLDEDVYEGIINTDKIIHKEEDIKFPLRGRSFFQKNKEKFDDEDLIEFYESKFDFDGF